jgi:hypothetical protein
MPAHGRYVRRRFPQPWSAEDNNTCFIVRPFPAFAQRTSAAAWVIQNMVCKAGFRQTPVPKVSFVTNVGDLGCGVGYYK